MLQITNKLDAVVIDKPATGLRQEWSEFERWSSKEKIIIPRHQQCSSNSEEMTILAMESTDVEVSGSIIIWGFSDNPAWKYWLGESLTAPQHRGKGIAGKWIRALVDAALSAGYPALWPYSGWRRVEESREENEGGAVVVYGHGSSHCSDERET